MNVELRKSNCGRKRNHVDLAIICDVSPSQRCTVRSVTAALSVPRSTLFPRTKRGETRFLSSSDKRFLTEKKIQQRLEVCKSHINTEKAVLIA